MRWLIELIGRLFGAIVSLARNAVGKLFEAAKRAMEWLFKVVSPPIKGAGKILSEARKRIIVVTRNAFEMTLRWIKGEMLRTITIIIALSLIALVSLLFLFISFWLALACFIVLTAWFVINGIKIVPANPPYKGVIVFLGRRQENKILKEGWCFLPIYPIIFKFILIKVVKVNYEFEPHRVRTPDRAEISVKASITWIPGIKDENDRDVPSSYIAYLNSDGETGVKSIIQGVIEDRIKTWAASDKEGPSNWMEALALKDDAHVVLTKALLGDALERLPGQFQGIPTNTWMRFLDDPESEPTKYDANPRNGWAFKDENNPEDWNWKGLRAIYKRYTDDQKKELKDRIDKRRKDIRAIREGKGKFGDEGLGITIVRFTVNEIKVEGEVAKAAELEEKERREREADKMEIENVSARIKKLREDNPEMSLEEAVRTVQTERGKISKSVIEVLGAATGAGQDLLGLAGVVKEIVKDFKRGGGASGGGNQGGSQQNTSLPPLPPGVL